MTENRSLGPLMLAEGWRCSGGESLYWTHRTGESVTLCDVTRDTADGIRAFPCEPSDLSADGYVVAYLDVAANGIPVVSEMLWVESYATALRLAIYLRAVVLGGAVARVGWLI